MAKTILCYIARHGSTKLNGKADCFRGPLDVPLDEKGIRDAHQLGYYFQDCELFPTIFCSSKTRTKETARIINNQRAEKLAIHPNDDLCAWNVGYLGGKPKDDENEAIVDHYCANPTEQIPEGESLNEFKFRVRPLIKEAIEAADRSGLPVLLVAHSSVIHEVGSMLYDDHKSVLVEPGGVAAIYYDGDSLQAEPIFKGREGSSQTDHVT